jgi:hypothetical protein
MCYNVDMSKFIYKIESCIPQLAAAYAIRYVFSEDSESQNFKEEYAKTKGGKEFKTEFSKNNTGYEVFLGGRECSREEYELF